MKRAWTIIGVKDVPASFRWYQSLFGQPETAPAHDYWGQILDSNGTVLLCLHEWGSHEHPSLTGPDRAQPGNGLLLFFRVDDFDATLQRVRAHRSRLEEEPHLNPNTRTMEFSLRDPDGYYVTISSLTEPQAADSLTVKIRVANEADVPALIVLLRRSWLTTWAPELPFSAVQRFAKRDPAREFAETKWRELVVAEIGGAIAGALYIEENWIRSIELAPESKRQGIGSQIMEHAERTIGRNYSEARLDVRAFNKGALKFYEQRGWTETRRYEATECGSPVETIEMVKTLRQNSI